jgi:hypothetical protein
MTAGRDAMRQTPPADEPLASDSESATGPSPTTPSKSLRNRRRKGTRGQAPKGGPRDRQGSATAPRSPPKDAITPALQLDPTQPLPFQMLIYNAQIFCDEVFKVLFKVLLLFSTVAGDVCKGLLNLLIVLRTPMYV